MAVKKPSPRSNAKTKYLRDYKRFQKRIQTAEERGFTVPDEIKNIKEAKGFYKQASERLKKLDLQTIERQSTFHGISGARALNLARAEQRRTGTTLEKGLVQVGKMEDLRKELEKLYKDSFEAITGKKNAKPSKPIEYGTSAGEVQDMLQHDLAKMVADEEAVLQQVDNEITRLIFTFKNFPLQKSVMDKYVRALDQNREKLLTKLLELKDSVIAEMQKVAEEPYEKEEAAGDDEWFGQSEFGEYWSNVLEV